MVCLSGVNSKSCTKYWSLLGPEVRFGDCFWWYSTQIDIGIFYCVPQNLGTCTHLHCTGAWIKQLEARKCIATNSGQVPIPQPFKSMLLHGKDCIIITLEFISGDWEKGNDCRITHHVLKLAIIPLICIIVAICPGLSAFNYMATHAESLFKHRTFIPTMFKVQGQLFGPDRSRDVEGGKCVIHTRSCVSASTRGKLLKPQMVALSCRSSDRSLSTSWWESASSDL